MKASYWVAEAYTIYGNVGEWLGHIMLEDSSGHLSIMSEWGNYQFMWPESGRKSYGSFKAFLVQCDNSYLHSKLMYQTRSMGLKKANEMEYSERLHIFLEKVWPTFKQEIQNEIEKHQRQTSEQA